MSEAQEYIHRKLACGVDFAALPLSGRRTAAYEIRVQSGLAHEPPDRPGVGRLVEETIAKGTMQRSAQELSDAFDALGAQIGSGIGRESMVFRCSCLPEFVDRSLGLHAEMLRTPTFPDEFCEVGIALLQQELTALEDDPGELARRLIGPHAYGPVLGRHELGTRESLSAMTRDDIVGQWRETFSAQRLQITIGGRIDAQQVAGRIDQLFTGFHDELEIGDRGFDDRFAAGTRHHPKQLEQQHLLICWPGVRVADDEYPTEKLTIAMLGEGMSSRLFAEVREKQGLVYWVGAWDEHPRSTGRLFMGASTTPARCDQTYQTLLREVSRLAEDVSEDELERARVGIIARNKTHGDITRARVGELATDLFHYGRPMRTEEKHARLRAVTVAEVRRYLEAHPRDELCVLTLGPRSLETGGAG